MAMFDEILIANRGDNGRQAVAAKTNGAVRGAHVRDLDPVETIHV